MPPNQLPDREDVRRLIDRLAPTYGQSGDMPLQVLQRAAAKGDVEAKSLLDSLNQSRPVQRSDTFWNR
jgi:hypothetical protein